MTAVLWRLTLIIILSSLPVTSWGADVGKLRYTASLYSDEKGTGLFQPEGVACSEKYGVVVGDTRNDRLVRFSLQEKTLGAGNEIKLPQLLSPVRVQINSKGEIFALDGKQRRIVRLGADGTFKGYVTAEGAPDSATVVPRSFKIDREDNIYILDVFSGRVVVLSADGKYQRQIEFPKEQGFISDLAVDPKGSVILVDSVKARLFSAAKNSNSFSPLGGTLREYLSFPAGITADSRGMLYIVDQNGAAIGTVSQDGSFLGKQLSLGWNEGLLYYPSQMCVTEKGEVFIADRGNSRVQLFTVVK